MGACLTLLRQAGSVLAIEAAAATDNPLVLTERGEILSGGNFHAEPVAFAADQIALAVSEIGALTERRLALLVDPAMSELPAFLTPEPGINSGFMAAEITAAALAAEEQAARGAGKHRQPDHLREPGGPCVDGDPRRAPAGRDERQSGQDRRDRMARRRPGYLVPRAPEHEPPPSPGLSTGCAPSCPPLEEDRYMAPDIEAAVGLVRAGALVEAAGPEGMPGW